MQLITTRNKEISFAELKEAISSGNGLELIRPRDKFAIELKNGELVNAVCGGYVNEKRARFVLEDCLAEKWRMNDAPTNKGGYLKSEGRRHVLEDILPLFPDELAEAFVPRSLVAPFSACGLLHQFRECEHRRDSQLQRRGLFPRLRARL